MSRTLFKPSGLPVFPPHADPQGACLLGELLAEEPWRERLGWPSGFEGGIAHRLDTGTSGAIWVADEPEELQWMRELFKGKRLRKRYLLRTSRDVPWDSNVCDRPLAHARRRKGRMVVKRGVATPHRGRWYEARTWFFRVRDGVFRAEMRTGVMHQIRAHAAFLGIPIVGDRKYGGGPAPPGATVELFLHHEGLEGPGGVGTAPVDAPPWLDVNLASI